MIRKQNNKKLLYALITLLLLVVTVISGRGIIPAFAYTSSCYSSVLTDLQKDSSFNTGDYPYKADDYSIQVIQVVESTDGELFVYTYQPCQLSRHLLATNINMSLSESPDNTKLYVLMPIDTNGVLCKYIVKGIKVSNAKMRCYNITSIYRPWDKEIDSDTENGNTVNEVSYEVGKLFIAETANGRVTYHCVETDVIEIIPESKYVRILSLF